MKIGTTTHPKFRRLQKRLGLPSYAVVGLLEMLWAIGAQYAEDGDLSRFSAQDIADYCDYEGDADDFVAALVECRWVDQNGEYKCIHDWEDHRPSYLQERLKKRRQRVTSQPANPAQPQPKDAIVPGHSGTSAGLSRDIPGQSGTFQDIPGNSVPTQPNHAQPNQAMPNHSLGAGSAPETSSKRFSPPSVQAVQDYCNERGNGLDAELFVDFYQARGWKLTNGKVMADWQAAVRTWEKNDTNRSNGRGRAIQQTFAQIREENTRKSIEEFVNGSE